MQLVGLVLVWIVAIGIIVIGVLYLLRQEANAAGFGLPVFAAPEARAWWQVKGIRDIATGVAPIVLIFVQPAALPWLILAEALIPIGDLAIILGNRGSRARAFGVHGATAVVMIVAAVLLLL